MMKKKCSTLFFSVAVLFSPLSSALETVEFQYLSPTNPADRQAQSAIKESQINQLFAELANQYFPFSQRLTVQYFIGNNYQEKFGRSAQLGTIDTLLHTLLHEGGHAYIADRNIPILGKEEDAVDNFAAIMMIEYVEGGDDAAISAADMFAFESQQRPDYYDWGEYIDEHSFDLQRYFSTLCLVYGSDTEKHAALLDEVEKDYLSERKQFCRYQFQTISHNWHRYLHHGEQE
ncbi:DUF4344 domain-containing metallopeptidase [Vibrio scophthalmi]|uniref:DUF4344 domain-containing metallopeptidase n=1 Tax=Vibrio scophthalmi TaxID=45658 RepID=UPI003AAB1D28